MRSASILWLTAVACTAQVNHSAILWFQQPVLHREQQLKRMRKRRILRQGPITSFELSVAIN